MLLPDVNVWLALANEGHKHHQAVEQWFETVAKETAIYFCRMTQQGFLRLASNATVAGKDVVSLLDAWKAYDTMLNDPRVEFVGEPPGLEPVWRRFTQSELFSSKIWNDAYLAAFANVYDLEVITFDQGFKAYDGVKRTILR